MALLRFTQLDYAGRLGLADGRYLARAQSEEEGDRVLIVQTLGGPHPEARLRRRRAKRVESPGSLETVPVTRVTVAQSRPFDDRKQAERWLRQAGEDPGRRVAEARSAVELLNRALEALREATEDPLVHDVGASQALAIRIGWGTGEQLAEGAWTDARQLPPPPTPRRAALDPQEHVARILAGREAEGEEDREPPTRPPPAA